MDKSRVFNYLELERMTDFSTCKTNGDVYDILDNCIYDLHIAIHFDLVNKALSESIFEVSELLYRLIALTFNELISTDELEEICVNRLNEFVAKKTGV